MDPAATRWAMLGLRVFFAVLVAFLYVPLVLLTVFSFNAGDPSFPLEGFTLDWYHKFLTNPALLSALERSAIVATVSSLLAVTLGVLSSFVLVRRQFRAKPVVSSLVFSPLVIPYVVFGTSLLVLFAAVDRLLTDTFGLVIGVGLHAIVIGHVVVSLPYTILTIMPLLEGLSTSFEEAARDLGANTSQTFRRVTGPLLAPALMSAFMISFTLSFDEYAIASFLSGQTPTWPVYLFAQLRVPSQLPKLLAVSTVVFSVSVVLVLAAEIGRRRSERRTGVATIR